MNGRRQFILNDDYPQSDIPNDQEEFPETVITDCHFYQGRIFEEDGSPYTDENEVSVFPLVVPYCDVDTEGTSTRIHSETANREPADYAYWIKRQIREAIYGGVFEGELLRRLPGTNASVRWARTGTNVAIKKLDYDRVIREGESSAERPMEEIKAMQYLQRHIAGINDGLQEELSSEDIRLRAQQGIIDHNVMTSIDILTDNIHLYVIMPFCDGDELFDVVEKTRFSETEARHWFSQILNALETLQDAGICHRDISLENVMTSGDQLAIVIDFGMCLKIPYVYDEQGNRQRCLIRPDRACGKPYYMSPEIRSNSVPFDGHAVDMWALGPMLFMMVCGFAPWEQSVVTNEKFRLFSGGVGEQLMRHWNLGLSDSLMDLLQRMFLINPRHRLSLAQVRSHPWMALG